MCSSALLVVCIGIVHDKTYRDCIVHTALTAAGCVPTVGLWTDLHPRLPYDVIDALCVLVTKLVGSGFHGD